MPNPNDNINQKPGCNQPQAPRAVSVESVDDASAQAPLNDIDDCSDEEDTQNFN